jgi:hypothetical protein
MAGLLCAIHQPNFLPRLSTLAKLYAAADSWIILDDVQFTRRDYQQPQGQEPRPGPADDPARTIPGMYTSRSG